MSIRPEGPQVVAAWWGTVRAPHTEPRAELTAARALLYAAAPEGVALQLVADRRYELGVLSEIDRPGAQDHRSANFDIWMKVHGQ